MSIEVKTIDDKLAKDELKKCPKIVQEYVQALEGVYKMNKATLEKAIDKLKQASRLEKISEIVAEEMAKGEDESDLLTIGEKVVSHLGYWG